MYKLLIVDDEYLSRHVFHTLISKKFDNVEIVGEAENGRQAILLNKKLRPDIIIMDIKMPGINGIDASREIIAEYPDTSILIITAYDNFDYVKSALDIGVKGYILKPIKEKEAVEKIEKVIKSIEQSTNKHNFKEEVENKVRVVRPYIESELVSSFIVGDFDEDKVKSYINFLQEEINAGYFIRISDGGFYSQGINEQIRSRIVKEKIYSVAVKFLPLMKKCFFGKCIGNTIVAFFPVSTQHKQEDVSKEAVMIGNEIKERIKVITGLNVGVGIGTVYNGLKSLNKSYNEASYALKLATEKKKVILFNSDNENEDSKNTPITDYFKLEDELIEQMKIGNMTKAKSIADSILSRIFYESNNISMIKEYICELLFILKRAFSKIGIDVSSQMKPGVLLEISRIYNYDELRLWSKRSIFNIIEHIEDRLDKNLDVMNKVYEYVNRNCFKDITLDLVAREVNLSPQYLSKTFKERYGVNFIDYVTSKRISYAEELLEKGNKTIKDISKIVGYEDANYFCKLFKKDKGLTPKQYRMQKMSGDM